MIASSLVSYSIIMFVIMLADYSLLAVRFLSLECALHLTMQTLVCQGGFFLFDSLSSLFLAFYEASIRAAPCLVLFANEWLPW